MKNSLLNLTSFIINVLSTRF